MATDRQEDLTGARLGDYRIERRLGAGAMSVCYRAMDLRLSRPVALKVLAAPPGPPAAGEAGASAGSAAQEGSAARARFLAEARHAAAIDHPNVVPVYGFGERDGRAFLAMRLIEGTDLAALVAAGRLEPARAIGLLAQLADALDALHARELVHLDVKPANALVTTSISGREHVYLADFGLVHPTAPGTESSAGRVAGGRAVEGSAAAERPVERSPAEDNAAEGHAAASSPAEGPAAETQAGADFVGSPSYAAPEHLRGQGVDGRTDQYSLACVLYACLTGTAPYTGDVHSVLRGHLGEAVPAASAVVAEVPGALDEVLASGMAQHPDQRYGSCGELIAAARAALAGTSESLAAAKGPLDPERRGEAPERPVPAPGGSQPRVPEFGPDATSGEPGVPAEPATSAEPAAPGLGGSVVGGSPEPPAGRAVRSAVSAEAQGAASGRAVPALAVAVVLLASTVVALAVLAL